MAKPLTDNEREQITALLNAGKSRATIAKEVGRSVGSVNRVAATIGYRSDQSTASRTRRAREARSSYAAEKRAAIAEKFAQRAEELLDAMEGEYLVFNFGGRENTYEEHVLQSPPTEAKRQMMQAAREGMRTVLDIDRHDNRNDEDIDAVSRWLREIVGGS